MAKIEDSELSPIKPAETYRRECYRAADLFQRALEEIQRSKDNPNKQAEMEKIMDKAGCIIQKTIDSLEQKELKDREKKLMKDYSNFKKEPSDEKVQLLDQDISYIKDILAH